MRIRACPAQSTILSVLTITSTSVQGAIIFESAESGPTGQTSGSFLSTDPSFYSGTKFQVSAPIVVRSIGGHFGGNVAGDDVVFGAIVALNGPGDFPDEPDLSGDDVLGAALIAVPFRSENVVSHLRLQLEPGWYAMVFGSGRFGAKGDSAGAIQNNTPVGGVPIFSIRQSDGLIINQAPGARFFIDSEPLPIFRAIADQQTLIPGTNRFFEDFRPPSIRDGAVAFRGVDLSSLDRHRIGIYMAGGGSLRTMADLGTLIPGSTEPFNTFGPFVSISDGVVAFHGRGLRGFGHFGIYASDGTGLTVVADSNTVPPGGGNTFESLSSFPSINHGDVAFTGVTEPPSGSVVFPIFKNVNGVLKVVADEKTPLPGALGNFAFRGNQYVSLDHGKVAFVAVDDAESIGGIYTDLYGEGTLSAVADTSTPIPGGKLRFGSMNTPILRRARFVFAGGDVGLDPNEYGIYIGVPGNIHPIADLTTLIPSGDGTFDAFGGHAFDGLHVAFIGCRDGQCGIYSDLFGSLRKVVHAEETVLGNPMQIFLMGPEAIDVYRIAFYTMIFQGDGGEAIYVAEYPAVPGDVDADGFVDLSDVADFMCRFGNSGMASAPGDFDGNMATDETDFRMLLDCLGGPDDPFPCPI